MSLENDSLWVNIFEGSLSDPDGFQITESSHPGLAISINVFSPLYKVVASCPNSRPHWWLAGSLVERAGTSYVIDLLEVGRYVVPRDREVLLRPRFRDVPFYYVFEPAYWHTQVDLTVWAWIGDENQTPKSSLESEMFAIATSSMENHLGLSNPHGITLQLLGGASQADLNAIASDIQALQNAGISQADLDHITGMAEAYTDQSFEEHLGDINPHDITPESINAVRDSLFEELEGEVEVLKNQTISESDFGNVFTAYATSSETLPVTPTQIGATTPEDIESAIDDHLAANNPHGITAEAIGLMPPEKLTLVVNSPWEIGWSTAPTARREGKRIMLSGMVACPTPLSQDTEICTLPVGWRPNHMVFASAFAYATDNGVIDVTYSAILILVTGQILGALADRPITYHALSIDNISFATD